MNVVMFGQSHFFGDLFDIISASGHKLSKVVFNCEEKPSPGRPAFQVRRDRLPYPVETLNLEEFRPEIYREQYVVGFSGSKMEPLLLELRKFGLDFKPLIHPSACLQSGAELDAGVIVDARAIVGPWARIERHVILNRGASIGHDSVVGAYSFVGPGAVLAGHVKLGVGVFVGAGATVIPDVMIGEGAVVAAGAVVTKDVPPKVMVAGVPAAVKASLKPVI
jgi:sugar O-acyltransferase (sialic acid O-acetyltransferase NeuD family)